MANTRTRAGGPAGAAADSEFGSAAQRDRHRRILDATLALASKGGYEAVQMRAVAERADVALGTLYRYFPSKIHLLVYALARELERYLERLERRPVPGETPYDRVPYVLRRATRTMAGEPRPGAGGSCPPTPARPARSTRWPSCWSGCSPGPCTRASRRPTTRR